MREREDRERMSSKVAKKASVPLSFCIFDWTKSYIHMNTSFLPLYFPSGYLFWKAAMHNKGSVLCLLVGWGANTPQLIMCLSVAVWAAAKGIRSSICECCSPHSRMPCHASQISSFLKREGKKNILNKWRKSLWKPIKFSTWPFCESSCVFRLHTKGIFKNQSVLIGTEIVTAASYSNRLLAH